MSQCALNFIIESEILSFQGYCIDLIEEMAKKMNFDYEIVLPDDNREDYGSRKPDGSWSGLIGDLVNRKIDIAVAGLTVTTEREEMIEFVKPYFEQFGISILMRKPVQNQSMFKFLKVLGMEVWLSILAAILITALWLWFLDKFSPYSGQNRHSMFYKKSMYVSKFLNYFISH